jgi:hypothetical protein
MFSLVRLSGTPSGPNRSRTASTCLQESARTASSPSGRHSTPPGHSTSPPLADETTVAESVLALANSPPSSASSRSMQAMSSRPPPVTTEANGGKVQS